jgi:hypothetical protein
MSRGIVKFVFLALFCVTISNHALAGGGVSALRGGACGGGGGNDVPTPFDVRNQKFELADGEIYVLFGRVIIGPSVYGDISQKVPYLKVDLQKQGWLGNFQRREFPYYPIEADLKEWSLWEQKEVKVICKARGRIVWNNSQPQYVIYLEPITHLRLSQNNLDY